MAFRRFKLTIEGTRPLICSNPGSWARIDPQTLAKIVDRAGIAEGLGTWRPTNGRFQVTQLEEVELG